MGTRYYDPRSGRFLSPDPVGYPLCLDLYAYAGGDPVNYHDPDGRFFSAAYQKTAPVVMGAINNPHFLPGAMRALGGFAEVSVGSALTFTPFAPYGTGLFVHGADQFAAGAYEALFGKHSTTATAQLLQKTGMDPETAAHIDDHLNFINTLCGAGLLCKLARGAAAPLIE